MLTSIWQNTFFLVPFCKRDKMKAAVCKSFNHNSSDLSVIYNKNCRTIFTPGLNDSSSHLESGLWLTADNF